MDGLSASVSRAVLTLDSYTQQAQVAHQLQVESTQAATQLVETITHLSSTTYEEIEKINSTAALLRESLMIEQRDKEGASWKEAVVWIVEMVWRGSLTPDVLGICHSYADPVLLSDHIRTQWTQRHSNT
jgi:hypothetical protein